MAPTRFPLHHTADQPVSVALIGSRRAADPEEAARLASLGTWLVRHGIAVRSGGASHADQAWVATAARERPDLVTVSLPYARDGRSHAAPAGVHVERPPYDAAYAELAAAEWTLRDHLPALGVPPFDPPLVGPLAARIAARWASMAREKPWLAALMVRNARIICPTPTTRVALVLAVYPLAGDAGGTGHGVRLAQAAGAPTVNLRDGAAWAGARPLLRGLAAAAAASAARAR